jgi:hypothetical protein
VTVERRTSYPLYGFDLEHGVAAPFERARWPDQVARDEEVARRLG